MGPQSRYLGNSLRSTEFNYMVDEINRVVGPGSIGYDQDHLVVSRLSAGDEITDAKWRELLLAISSAAKHQGYTMTGPISVEDPLFNNRISKIVVDLNTDIAILVNDWFTHEPSQLSYENTSATRHKVFGNPTTGLNNNEAWNRTRWYGFKATFEDDDAILGFFNAGGEIHFTPSLENYEITHANSTAWHTFLDDIGQLTFSSLGMTGANGLATPFHINPIDVNGNPIINLGETYEWNPGMIIQSFQKQMRVFWRIWQSSVDILIKFVNSNEDHYVVGDLTVTVDQTRAQADPEIEPDYNVVGVISTSPMYTTSENFTTEPIIDPTVYSNIRMGDNFQVNAATLAGILPSQLVRTDTDTIITANTTWTDGNGIYLGTDQDFFMRHNGVDNNTLFSIYSGKWNLTNDTDVLFVFDPITKSLVASGDVTAFG